MNLFNLVRLEVENNNDVLLQQIGFTFPGFTKVIAARFQVAITNALREGYEIDNIKVMVDFNPCLYQKQEHLEVRVQMLCYPQFTFGVAPDSIVAKFLDRFGYRKNLKCPTEVMHQVVHAELLPVAIQTLQYLENGGRLYEMINKHLKHCQK